MRDPRLASLLPLFQAEVAEHVDAIVQFLDEFPSMQAPDFKEAHRDALRRAHGVKGSAQSLGFPAISRAAHLLEDALVAWERSEEARRDPAWSRAMGRLALALRRMSEEEDGGDGPGRDNAPIAEVEAIVGRPVGAASGAPSSRPPVAPFAPPALPAPAPVEAAPAAPPPPASESIRVATTKLDSLVSETGELITAGARIQELQRGWNDSVERLAEMLSELPRDAREALGGVASAFERQRRRGDEEVRELGALIAQLRETVKATRMVALESEAASWRLAVREPADALGKEVMLRLDLAGVELDKVVVERLRQPMLHLLRNAVDHGIEAPADRFAFAKTRWGTIDVRARLMGTMVRIEVRDDGRGLDRAVIEQKAVERGLVTAAAASSMPDHAAFALLFSPGFSTREEAGPWSGRGVGLDVVARVVEQLGGHVHIASAGPAQGTSVTLILPASVVSTRGLLASAGGAVLALPVELVGRVTRVDAAHIGYVDGRPMLCEPGRAPVPAYDLVHLVRGAGPPRGGRFPVIIVERGAEHLAVMVDAVLHDTELVVRPLPWDVRGTAGISGAALLADGRIALVLDAAYLFEARAANGRTSSVAADLVDERSEDRTESRAGARPPVVGRKARVLVADDSLTARTLARETLDRAGYEVTVAVDGAEAAAILGREPFDALVSDVEMPGLDGFALTRKVRAEPRLKHLPVILVTSRSAPAMVDEGARAGADEYVVKGEHAMGRLLAALARQLGQNT